MSGKQGQRSTKPADVPALFAPGFLHGMDGRKSVPRAVAQTITDLTEAATGGDPSPQAQILIEHATWTHMRLRQLQTQFLETGELDYKQHSALLNSLVGCLRSIGLQRVARKAEGLQDYLKRIASENSGGSSAP